MFQANSIETCVSSWVERIAGPGWMHGAGSQTWCTGGTCRDRVGVGVGGGIGMLSACGPMALSFQCMTGSTTIKIYIYIHIIDLSNKLYQANNR